MDKDKRDALIGDELLRLFRAMSKAEVTDVLRTFRENDQLRLQGYGWKRVTMKCSLTKCSWRGKRVWGKKMFDRPCPKCGSQHSLWAGN